MALLALLFLAPLPFGCIEDWSHWLLVFLLGILFCLFLLARAPFRLDRRLKVSLCLAAAYLGWLFVQMVPLPPELLSSLSPAAARLYATAVPGLGEADAAGYAYPDAERPPDGEERGEIEWITPRFSSWRSLSLHPYGSYRIFWLTAALLAFVMMGSSLFHEEHHRRQLVYTLVALGASQALYGAIETLSGHQHILLYEKLFYTDVATGTLINRNHFAAMLNMSIPLAAGLLLAARSRDRYSAHPAREPLLAAAVIAMGIGVALSRSRMGLASTAAGLVVLSLLILWARPADAAGIRRSRWRLALTVMLPIALLALVVFYSIGIDTGETLGRFRNVTSDLSPDAIRPSLWRESLPAARDFLLTGAGTGAFVHAVNPRLRELPIDDFWLFQHAHNDYLEWIVMLGLVGIALGGAAFLIHAARRPRSVIQAGAMAGLVTLLVHSLTDFNLSMPSNGLIACALTILILPEASRRRTGSGQRRPRPLGPALLVPLALVLIAWPGRSLVAALVYRPHYNKVTHLPEVLSALSVAGAIEPANDSYWRFRADGEREAALRLSPGDLDVGADLRKQIFAWRMSQLEGLARAQRHYIESLDRNPLNHELHHAVARTGAEIRGLERLAGLPRRRDEGPGADALLSPYRTSAALAPTAYGNLARLGALLWSERAHLGGGGETLALDLMARAAARRVETGNEWIDGIIRATQDPTTLSRLDAVLKPLSTSYYRILDGKNTSERMETCVSALFDLARLREAENQFENHLSGHYVLDRENLAGLRERARKLHAAAVPRARRDEGGPCRDGRAIHDIVGDRSARLLERVDTTGLR